MQNLQITFGKFNVDEIVSIKIMDSMLRLNCIFWLLFWALTLRDLNFKYKRKILFLRFINVPEGNYVIPQRIAQAVKLMASDLLARSCSTFFVNISRTDAVPNDTTSNSTFFMASPKVCSDMLEKEAEEVVSETSEHITFTFVTDGILH